MLKVLITGITGFLGAHIAKKLCDAGIHVIGLKRLSSDTWRCKQFESKVEWLNLDNSGEWIKALIELKPEVIVHCAWQGVEANSRESWSEQASNINFLIELLEVSKEININKFIFLGSQAEYGMIQGRVSEDESAHPVGAYGTIKSVSLEIVKTFCEECKINWIWLRVFSVFGEMESSSWLIPSLINRMHTDAEMDFTGGEQQYAYLYVQDFSAILKVIIEQTIPSGVYNISSNIVYSLKTLVEQIRDEVNVNFKLNFGVIPYRKNQSMHIEGDISKLASHIELPDFTNFKLALQQTINYYKFNRNSNESF